MGSLDVPPALMNCPNYWMYYAVKCRWLDHGHRFLMKLNFIVCTKSFASPVNLDYRAMADLRAQPCDLRKYGRNGYRLSTATISVGRYQTYFSHHSCGNQETWGSMKTNTV